MSQSHLDLNIHLENKQESLEVTELYHISYNMGVCLNFRIYRQVRQLDFGANEQLVTVKKKVLSINTCALSKWF